MAVATSPSDRGRDGIAPARPPEAGPRAPARRF